MTEKDTKEESKTTSMVNVGYSNKTKKIIDKSIKRRKKKESKTKKTI